MRAILVGIVLGAVAVVLVWFLFGDSHDESPTADLLRELRTLETEAQSERASEILAVHQESLRVARELLEQYPASHEALDVVAWTYLRVGRTDESRKCWERCVEMAPDFGDGYFWLGRLAHDVGEEERAVELFRRAIAHQTTNRAAAVLLAKSLENLGRFAEAATILEAEDKSNPNNPAILVLLGQVYLKAKDYGNAKRVFEKAVALEPDVPGVNFGLVTAYTRLGDQAKAKQAAARFEKEKNAEQEKRGAPKPADGVKTARHDLAGVYTAAGKVYYAQGDARRAEECWRRAAETVPSLFEPRLVLAWALQQQGRNDDALAVLAELAKTNPESPEAYLRLGDGAAGLRRFDVAERAYRDAIRVAPRSAAGHVALARLYLETGRDTAKAVALARQAVELEPRVQNYSLLASAALAGGDRTAALAAVDRALAQDPDNAYCRELRNSIQRGR